MIFMGSFVVMPPEVKSGDLPGVAIKLIYSPSLEKAMIDCKEFDESIDKMKRLFLHGYGTEKGQLTKFLNLKIFRGQFHTSTKMQPNWYRTWYN